MEAKIDAWLKTYLNEMLISPVDWEDLPEECRIQLDNFARDEAVRRADAFANDGVLDLSHQDAIRQLVDAMAQAWKLPGDKVRHVVEDFYDALPPQPGEEFEKLAIRLYRRTQSYSWHEILQTLEPEKESNLVSIVLTHADLPADARLDKTSFLKGMRYSYDSWTLTHPKDAVAEVIDTLGISDDTSVNLPDLLPLVQKRGASTWARSLELELEVDVETASREDLIRILKRYALIVRREGGLAPAEEDAPLGVQAIDDSSNEVPLAEENDSPEVEEKAADETTEETADSDVQLEQDAETPEESPDGATEDVQESSDEMPSEKSTIDDTPISMAADETVVEQSLEVADDEPVESIPGQEEPASGSEDAEPEVEEEEIFEETIDSEDQKEDDSGDLEMTDEDQDALDSMFGEETTEDMPDVAKSYWEEQEGSPSAEVSKPESEIEEVDSDEQDEVVDGEIEETVVFEPEEGVEFEEESADEKDDEDPEVEADAQDSSEEDSESSEEPGLEISEEEEPKTRLQDVFVPSPQGDDRDRFANLRTGDLRDKIVREMYEGDSTMLDVFLAKLSGAPDWNRAKQFIANEFFRCKLDLHSELGEQFFLELKESLRDQEL